MVLISLFCRTSVFLCNFLLHNFPYENKNIEFLPEAITRVITEIKPQSQKDFVALVYVIILEKVREQT